MTAGGSLSSASVATASSRPSSSTNCCTIQSGCDVRVPIARDVVARRAAATAGRSAPASATHRSRSRGPAPARRRRSRPTAACGETPVNSWNAPSRKRGPHVGVERVERPRRRPRPSRKSSARRMRTVPYTSSVTNARSRGSSRLLAQQLGQRGCARTRRRRCARALRPRVARGLRPAASCVGRGHAIDPRVGAQPGAPRRTRPSHACLRAAPRRARARPSAVHERAARRDRRRAPSVGRVGRRRARATPSPAGHRPASTRPGADCRRARAGRARPRAAAGSRRNSSTVSFSAYVGSPTCGTGRRAGDRRAAARRATRCRPRPSGRAARPRSRAGRSARARVAYTGPVSRPASSCMRHTPVSASPARIARSTGAAPAPARQQREVHVHEAERQRFEQRRPAAADRTRRPHRARRPTSRTSSTTSRAFTGRAHREAELARRRASPATDRCPRRASGGDRVA